MYKRLQNLLVRCHKPTLTKPPSHSLMLIDYSDTSCPPNAPAVAQVLKPSKIMSTVSPSFLFCHDPKILAFLCFQSDQATAVAKVSNPLLSAPWKVALAWSHQSRSVSSASGGASFVKSHKKKKHMRSHSNSNTSLAFRFILLMLKGQVYYPK